jgi:hypothetical protein
MHTAPRSILAVVVAFAAALALAPVAGAAPAEPAVPTAVAVPDGHKLYLVGHASGVQIYSCNGSAWGLVAPRADLVDDSGKVIISHFGGPSWQAKDGSLVVAQRDGQHAVDGTIAWLRLKATSTSSGADGGRLAGTTYIQRINTTGGVAPPASECDASKAGTVVEVPYTADYYFWKARGA